MTNQSLVNARKRLVMFSMGFLVLLLMPHPQQAQENSASSSPQAEEASQRSLKIIVLEGEGAINNVRQRTAREPVIQVVDENNKPIGGAMVMFTLPQSGASGAFANGARTLLTYTNASGKAAATGLKANGIAGQFQMTANASYQGMAASATIGQANVAAVAAAAAGGAGAAAGISKTLIAIIAIAGGAAATGAAVAAGGGGSNGGPAPVTSAPVRSGTISGPGAPTFGPPNEN